MPIESLLGGMLGGAIGAFAGSLMAVVLMPVQLAPPRGKRLRAVPDPGAPAKRKARVIDETAEWKAEQDAKAGMGRATDYDHD